MHKINIDLLVCVSWICLIVGMLIAAVGTAPEKCEPYTWVLPLEGLAIMWIPALSGFLAGRASVGKSGKQK
jgi:hypothetical protein